MVRRSALAQKACALKCALPLGCRLNVLAVALGKLLEGSALSEALRPAALPSAKTASARAAAQSVLMYMVLCGYRARHHRRRPPRQQQRKDVQSYTSSWCRAQQCRSNLPARRGAASGPSILLAQMGTCALRTNRDGVPQHIVANLNIMMLEPAEMLNPNNAGQWKKIMGG